MRVRVSVVAYAVMAFVRLDDSRRMKRALRLTICALGLFLGQAFVPGGVFAQGMPNEVMQEQIIKETLLTFNDANITGDYAVFHAKLCKPFRDQYSADQLKEVFKQFAGQHMTVIATMKPISTKPANIDDDGVLTLTGYFDSKPNRVNYQLQFLPSDGFWKPLGITIDAKKPE